MNNIERYHFNKQKDTLSNLEKYWIEDSINWNPCLRRWQTKDGTVFIDKEDAINHEMKYYLTGWYEDN